MFTYEQSRWYVKGGPRLCGLFFSPYSSEQHRLCSKFDDIHSSHVFNSLNCLFDMFCVFDTCFPVTTFHHDRRPPRGPPGWILSLLHRALRTTSITSRCQTLNFFLFWKKTPRSTVLNIDMCSCSPIDYRLLPSSALTDALFFTLALAVIRGKFIKTQGHKFYIEYRKRIV